MLKIGCHVSNNGKLMLAGSVGEALSYDANCFMVYLGAPQNTLRKDVNELNIDKMHEIIDKNGIKYSDVIVHAPYIVNLGNPDPEKRAFGISFITKELKTVALLKARCLVLHPGAFMSATPAEGIERIAESLKVILDNTKEDDTVIALETMAGKGSEVGRSFDEINQIIKLVDSPRIKVCLDTCHIHDGGYDIINDYENVIKSFDQIIGLDKLSVIHLNDSKNECNTHKDRHENFGFGKIGFNALMQFVEDDRFTDIPKILETPYVSDDKDSYPPYKYEIAMIKSKAFDENLKNKIISGEKNEK